MKRVALGDVADLKAGVGFPLHLQGRRAGDYPMAKVGDISRVGRSFSFTMSTADHFIDESDVPTLGMRPVPEGSILFAKIGEAIRHNHRVVAGRPLLIDNNAMAAVPNSPNVDGGYLFRFLQSVDFYALVSSTTVPSLRKSDLERIRLPLPSLVEQRRIAAILDHADALRARRRQIIAYLDTLTQSMFRDMFGNPDEATDTVPFAEIAVLSGGRNLVAEDPAADSEYRVLKISAVTTGQFRPAESKPLPPDYVPPTAHLVSPGDLLMSRANTTDLVGAVAYVHETPSNLALPDKIWRFDWLDEQSVPLFFHALFSTAAVRRRISRLSSGTGGSMKNISKANLASLSLPRVGPEKQRDFAARVELVQTQRAHAQRALAADHELFTSLQSQAFRGDV